MEIFLYQKENSETHYGKNLETKDLQKSPCSTFKIANSIFGLQAGVITSKNYHQKYDPIKNPAQKWWPTSWKKDHSLSTAINNSVVWYYQKVARNIGKKKMQIFLNQSNYGNKNLNSPIDQFWLGASLKISPAEQIQFLKNAFTYKYNFSKENIDIVKEILLWKKTEEQKIFTKTGTCHQGNGRVGAWLVGWVESQNSPTSYFAYYTEDPSFKKAAQRRDLNSKKLLEEHLLKASKR